MNQLELAERDNEEAEYNFNRIKMMFYSVLTETFNINLSNIPTMSELLSATEETKENRIKMEEYEDGLYFKVPERMSPTTGLAFLCFLILMKGKSSNLKQMFMRFYKQRVVRRSHLDLKLYSLAKIQSDMFKDESFDEAKDMISFAKGMASFLYFHKYFPKKKNDNLIEYPSYIFFNNIINPKKAELGFGIPDVITTPDGDEISVDDLPVLGFQDSDNVNDYFDFSNPKVNEEGEQYFEPTEKVKKSNDLMRAVLNMGRGIDAFFRKKGYNIITLQKEIPEDQQIKLLNGELIFKNGQMKPGSGYNDGTNILLMLGPIKSSIRALEKAKHHFNNDISYLSDLVRASFVCTNSDQLKDFNKFFYEGMSQLGCHLSIRPRDRFTNPFSVGYGDILTVWLLPNNFACEIQISLIHMIIAKSKAHHYYKKERTLNAIAQERNLTKEEAKELLELQKIQKNYYNEARIKSGMRSADEIFAERDRNNSIKNKTGSVTVKFYDYNGMPSISRGEEYYYIDFSNSFRKVDIDEKYKFIHEAMQISRLQFDTLVKEFKEVLKVKGVAE
jgi:hypothetical protein